MSALPGNGSSRKLVKVGHPAPTILKDTQNKMATTTSIGSGDTQVTETEESPKENTEIENAPHQEDFSERGVQDVEHLGAGDRDFGGGNQEDLGGGETNPDSKNVEEGGAEIPAEYERLLDEEIDNNMAPSATSTPKSTGGGGGFGYERSPVGGASEDAPKIPAELTLEGLLAMTPVVHGIDVVRNASRDLFLSCVKSSSNVHDVFFSDHAPHALEQKLDPDWFEFDRFASLFVCQTICRLDDSYGIHEMIDEEKVNQQLGEIFMGPLWKKIGFAMYTLFFPDLVRDPHTGVGFRAYMQQGRYHWADTLSEKLRDSQWLYSIMRPVVQGVYSDNQYNRDMNLLFIKLHLLDPTAVFPAYDHLRKALPDLNLELVTTNYLGDLLDWRLIKPEVSSALQQVTRPNNVSRWSLDQFDVYYGIQVTEFIFLDARHLGVWTGRYPSNKRVSQLKDRIPLEKCTIL